MRPQKGLWRHRRDGGGAVVGKHVKLNNFLNDNTMMRPQKGLWWKFRGGGGSGSG